MTVARRRRLPLPPCRGSGMQRRALADLAGHLGSCRRQVPASGDAGFAGPGRTPSSKWKLSSSARNLTASRKPAKARLVPGSLFPTRPRRGPLADLRNPQKGHPGEIRESGRAHDLQQSSRQAARQAHAFAGNQREPEMQGRITAGPRPNPDPFAMFSCTARPLAEPSAGP